MKRPSLFNLALLTSLGLHLAGCMVLASVVSRALTRPRLAGSAGDPITLTVPPVEWTSPPLELTVSVAAPTPVLIHPGQAIVFQQRFVDSLTRVERLEQLEPIELELATTVPVLTRTEVPDPPREARVAPLPRRSRPVAPTTATGVSQRKSPPRFEHNPPPRYPDLAWQRRWEGVTLLRVFVDAAGRVSKVEVARTSGHELLDAAAVRAVKTWRGQPARRGGEPVETVELLPIDFRLR